MKNKNKTLNFAVYTLALGCYWACVSFTVGFAAPYLQLRGFTSGQLGALVALGNLGSLFLSTALSARTDSAGELSAIDYLFLTLGMQLLSLFMLLSNAKALVGAAYALLVVSVMSGSALYVKLFVTLSRLFALDGYGASRAAGSLLYALASFAGGAVLSSAPHYLLLLLNGLCALVQAVGLVYLRSVSAKRLDGAARSESRGESAAAPTGLLPFLRRNPGFPLVLTAIALIFLVHNSNSTFMINIVENIGGDVSRMGFINGAAILVEIPVMILCSRFARKHCKKLLTLSFLFFILKIWLTAVASDAVTLTLAYSLRAVAFALYTPAMVEYIDSRIPYEDSGKAQGLANNITQLGTVLGSLGFGLMLDSFSVTAMLFSFAVISTLGSLTGLLSLRRR